ncbi:hypothetical protein TrispH2_003822, partial [Trichoplax sp. H2]
NEKEGDILLCTRSHIHIQLLWIRGPPHSITSTMDIGQHCHWKECNRLDFLPFTCPRCSAIFW